MKVEKIMHKNEVLAIVADGNIEKGVRFLTSNDATLQFGVHSRSKGESVKPHYHNEIKIPGSINVIESFYVIKGKITVSFYDNKGTFLKKCIVSSGGSIVIFAPHALEFLEDTKMIEIKQGPYQGKKNDKVFLQ